MNTHIPGWDLAAVQTSAGWFDGQAWDLQIDGLQVLRESHRQVHLNQFGTAPAPAFVFGAPLWMAGEGLLNGRTWCGLSAWDGRREFDSIVPPMDLLTLVIDRAVLMDHAAITEQTDLSDWCARGCTLVNDATLTHRVATQLDQWLRSVALQTQPLDHPAVQRTLLQGLLDQLTPVIARHMVDAQAEYRDGNAMLVVRRAREFALAHIDQPLHMLDLCRAARVSRRTLQVAFNEVLGITPLRYLHALRLDGAHRMLRDPRPGLEVSDAAEAWGFWHLSRFAQAYRDTYGERPSETLRRAQGPHAEDT